MDEFDRARKILDLLKERRESLTSHVARASTYRAPLNEIHGIRVEKKDSRLLNTAASRRLIRVRNILDDRKERRTLMIIALNELSSRNFEEADDISLTTSEISTDSDESCSLTSLLVEKRIEQGLSSSNDHDPMRVQEIITEQHSFCVCPTCYSETSTVRFEDKCPAGKYCL